MMRFFFLLLMTLAPVYTWAIDYIPESDVKTADPFVMLDGDTYYLYGTRAGNPNRGFEAFSSKDLKTWKREGYVIKTGRSLYWAPEVYKFDGKYYMYYSANHKLYVATSDSPLGPFKDASNTPMINTGANTIDSSVFTDTLSNGQIQQWLFFVEENNANRIYRCKLNADHITADESTIEKVTEATESYELHVGYHCTEGPCVIKCGTRYFMMYSANTYNSIYYNVCVARTNSIEGNLWTKIYQNPILSYDKLGRQLYGVGHNGFFYDKNGTLRIVFHGYKNNKCEGTRRVYFGTMRASSASVTMNLDSAIISPKLYMGGYDKCDSLETAVTDGTSVCADLNNDGCLDLIIAGRGRQGYQNNTLLYNEENKTWTAKASSMQTAYRPSITPSDFNLDGNVDILTFDSLSTAEGIARKGLFLGDGMGNFSKQELTLSDENGGSMDISTIDPQTADVADFNNDGKPDIVVIGKHANVVLINQGNYQFTVRPWNSTLTLTHAMVKAADFDNDGYTDFIVSGATNNGATPYVALYRNEKGTFQQLSASQLGLRNMANGCLQIADINDDGWLDLFIQGSTSNVASTSHYRQYVYLNRKNPDRIAFSIDDSGTATQTNNNLLGRIQNSTPTSAALFDWDGDGLYDLFTAGRCEDIQSQVGFYYHNENGHLKEYALTSGGSSSTICFPDWDGDGKKDYFNAGYSTDDLGFNSDYKGIRSTIYLSSETKAERPASPITLNAEGKAGAVRLTWNPSPSAKSNCTYNYYVKDAQGKLLTQTLSFIDGNKDGILKTMTLGNAGCNHSITINLPAGDYTWGVQTVNAAYEGSPFTKSSFTVSESSVTAIQELTKKQRSEVARFNLSGQQVSAHYAGTVIIKYSDGSSIKQLQH